MQRNVAIAVLIGFGCGGGGSDDSTETGAATEGTTETTTTSASGDGSGTVAPGSSSTNDSTAGTESSTDGASTGGGTVELSGTYALSAAMQLGPRPGSFDDTVALTREFVEHPCAQLLRVSAHAAAGPSYWEDPAYEPLFEPCACAYPWQTQLSAIGQVAADVCLGQMSAALSARGGGDDIVIALAPAVDFIDGVGTPVLSGTLSIDGEADEAGVLAGPNDLAIDTLSWDWNGATHDLSLRGGGAWSTTFDGAVVSPPTAVAMDPFTLEPNGSVLVRAPTETITLPVLLVPSITGFAEMYEQLIDCQAIAAEIGGGAGAVVEASCETFQAVAQPTIDEWYTLAGADDPWAWTLGTPKATPCPTTPGSGTVQSLGTADATCTWQGARGTADWYAERL